MDIQKDEKYRRVNRLIKLAVASSVLGVSLITSSNVLAFDPKLPVGSKDFDIVDVASWDQMGLYGLVPDSKYGRLLGDDIKAGADSGGAGHPNYTQSACMSMSYATFMRKSGQKDKNWGPQDAMAELYDMGAYSGIFPTKMYEPGAKWGSWTLESYESGGLSTLKKAWNDGYGVIAHVAMPGGGTHVFTIDSVDGDKVYTLDTGRHGTSLDDPNSWGTGALLGVYKFKSSDGTKGSDLAKLNEVRDGSNAKSSSSGKKSEKTSSSDDSLPDEDDLVGLSKRNHKLYEYQLPIILPGDAKLSTGGDDGTLGNKQASAASVDTLSKEQRVNVENLNDSIRNNKFDLITFIRTCISFVGILIAFYGVTLFIAYLFDKNNIFFDISLLSIITFGRLKYSYDGSETTTEEGKTKYVNIKGIVKNIIITELLAYILYSGGVYTIISYIIEFIRRTLNI